MSDQMSATNLLQEMEDRGKTILEFWNRTTLLDELPENRKALVAQVLENQAIFLQQARKEMLREETQSTDIAKFDAVAFPMVRRIYGKMLAPEIVSVQPLTLPTGLLFYLDVQINASPGSASYSSVYDGLYDYGSQIQRTFGTGTAVLWSGGGGATEAAVWYNQILSAATTACTVPYFGGYQNLSTLRFYNSGGTEIPLGTWHLGPQTWGMDIINSGAAPTLTLRFPAGTFPTATKAMITYTSGSSTMEASTAMTEVKLVISATSVNAVTRKMKARWTPELAQDMQAYHAINAENELTGILSEEITAEIDREVIADLIRGAAFQTTWNWSRSSNADPASGFTTQKVWNQTLLTRVNELSAAIHKATLRAGANFIIASSEVCSVLDDMENAHVVGDASAPNEVFSMGMEKVGTLNGRYKVYRDPYLPSNILLMGHKGTNFLETGYVYAPYVPLQLTPVISDPEDFTPRRGIMTRYAKKMVNNKYYAVIRVTNLNTFARNIDF